MSVEFRGSGAHLHQEVAAIERSAVDQCLSGENPMHRRISDSGSELSTQVYGKDVPLRFRDAVTKLHTHVGRLQFYMEDLYDQLHRTRKIALPNAEQLEKLRAGWAAVADEAQQFAEDLLTTNDDDLVRDAKTYATAVSEMANTVAAAALATAPDATAPGQEKLAA